MGFRMYIELFPIFMSRWNTQLLVCVLFNKNYLRGDQVNFNCMTNFAAVKSDCIRTAIVHYSIMSYHNYMLRGQSSMSSVKYSCLDGYVVFFNVSFGHSKLLNAF